MKGLEIHQKQIEAFSIAAMRAPALVAAGGVAASLGFYSANYSRLAGKSEALDLFNASWAWLLAGLLLTVLAPGIAYFSQLAYSHSIENHEHTWEFPFSTETRRSRIAHRVGNASRWLCVALVLLSIAAVSSGGIKFLHLVATL